jgi:hypothetical protein
MMSMVQGYASPSRRRWGFYFEARLEREPGSALVLSWQDVDRLMLGITPPESLGASGWLPIAMSHILGALPKEM